LGQYVKIKELEPILSLRLPKGPKEHSHLIKLKKCYLLPSENLQLLLENCFLIVKDFFCSSGTVASVTPELSFYMFKDEVVRQLTDSELDSVLLYPKNLLLDSDAFLLNDATPFKDHFEPSVALAIYWKRQQQLYPKLRKTLHTLNPLTVLSAIINYVPGTRNFLENETYRLENDISSALLIHFLI
jgi:hypothetical protein